MPKLLLVNPMNKDTLYGDYGWQPLSLCCVAGATPSHWEIEIADEIIAPVTDSQLQSADVVGLTAFTTQAPRAYQIAARAKERGCRVVLGGVHATFMTAEASTYVDSVVTGEAEAIWSTVLGDYEAGTLQPTYFGERQTMEAPVVPRRDLLVCGAYAYASTQSTRGCPLNCSFCSVTAFNGRKFRMSGPDWVVDEFHRIEDDRILVVDDDFNGFSEKARKRAVEICNAISERAPKKRWMTQVTVNFGEDDELPRAAARAGCAAVFIGFESVSKSDLGAVSKKRYRGGEYYFDTVKRIRDAGIAIIGSFILGIEGQRIDRTVDETLEFLEAAQIDAFNPTILTPLPGTRDYERYAADKRLVYDRFPQDWAHYNLATPTVRSDAHSPARLYVEYLRWMSFFNKDDVFARAERTRNDLGEEAAEAAYLWNRAWSLHYRRALVMPRTLLAQGDRI